MSYKKRNRATRSARYAVCSCRGLGTYTLGGMRPRNGCQRRRRTPSASRWPVCLQLLVKVLHGSPSRLGAMVGLRDPTNRPKYLFCHKNEVTYAPRRPECRPRAPRVGPPGKHLECRRPLELSLKGPGFFRKKKRRPARFCLGRSSSEQHLLEHLTVSQNIKSSAAKSSAAAPWRCRLRVSARPRGSPLS